jgi:hypothetical protein
VLVGSDAVQSLSRIDPRRVCEIHARGASTQ